MGLQLREDIGCGEGSFCGAVVKNHDFGIGYFVVLGGTVAAGAVNVFLGGEVFVEAAAGAGEFGGGRGCGFATAIAGGFGMNVSADLCQDEGVSVYCWEKRQLRSWTCEDG